MKFVSAFYGTRGDVEPGLVVGHELVCRRHDEHMWASGGVVRAGSSDFIDVPDSEHAKVVKSMSCAAAFPGLPCGLAAQPCGHRGREFARRNTHVGTFDRPGSGAVGERGSDD